MQIAYHCLLSRQLNPKVAAWQIYCLLFNWSINLLKPDPWLNAFALSAEFVHSEFRLICMNKWSWSAGADIQCLAMSQLAAGVQDYGTLSVCTLAMNSVFFHCLSVRITGCFWLFIVLIISAAGNSSVCTQEQYPLLNKFVCADQIIRSAGNNLLPLCRLFLCTSWSVLQTVHSCTTAVTADCFMKTVSIRMNSDASYPQ